MKIFIALIKRFFHCLAHLHCEYYCHTITYFLFIPIWIKPHIIGCWECKKDFYNDGTKIIDIRNQE
jgi:hypothetical protein